ncbi:MAG: glycoside hydrolase family 5 protein [Planctomycetota bacterium]
MKCSFAGVLLLSLAASAGSAQISGPRPASLPDRPTRDARAVIDSGLGRGVNFGNMLEAPFEGAWGLTVEERFFDVAVQAGVDHVRLPVSWTHHTNNQPPYAIEPTFLDRVEWVVDQALDHGLKVIVNNHHYDELNADPVGEAPRALAIWQQVATRFADESNDVYFEVLNEPHGVFNDQPALWDAHLAGALDVIRQTNPTRWVLAGPVRYNSIGALGSFNPPADPRLVAAVHFYDPFAFTHQGATWVGNIPPVGTVWTGDAVSIGGAWDNWSWGTTVTPVADGLSIEYTQGWAGLYFRRGSAFEALTRVTFTADRPLALNVIVGVDGNELSTFVQTGAGTAQYTADFPGGIDATRVILQNATPNANAPWTISSLTVSDVAGHSEGAIFNEREAIDEAMRRAAAWANDRGMPIHLGEFGAYSPADMDSRARWTRAVREAAEREGIAWAYWELAAGFGFFDPNASVFRQPLLDALTD